MLSLKKKKNYLSLFTKRRVTQLVEWLSYTQFVSGSSPDVPIKINKLKKKVKQKRVLRSILKIYFNFRLKSIARKIFE